MGEAIVLGSLFSAEGGQLSQATLTVASETHPQLGSRREVPGVFSLRAPVGAKLVLTVEAPGHGPRRRALVVQASDPARPDLNRCDFGGMGAGQLWALVRHPEIVQTEPAHGAVGVPTSPLSIKMLMSRAIPEGQRNLLRRLVQVDVNGTQIVPGTSYNDQRAELEWNASGTEATFVFPAPLVTRFGEAAAVRLGFDSSVQEELWPQDEAGLRLGFQKVVDARDGQGLSAPSQVAPLLSTSFPGAPSGRLQASQLWALTHAVSAHFSLAVDKLPPRLLSVRAVPKAQSDGRGEVYVRFSEPMRAFPEALLDGGAIKSSAYRFSFGTVDKRQDREDFEALDPSKEGSNPIEVLYDALHPEVITLRTPVGLLERYTDFKLYVATSVKDPGGNAVLSDVDASTGRPANLWVGKVE